MAFARLGNRQCASATNETQPVLAFTGLAGQRRV